MHPCNYPQEDELVLHSVDKAIAAGKHLSFAISFLIFVK